MPLTYSSTKYGKQCLVYNNFLYYKEKEIKGKSIWKCTVSKKEYCKARVHTKDDEIIKNTATHNHSSDTAILKTRSVVNRIKVIDRELSDAYCDNVS